MTGSRVTPLPHASQSRAPPSRHNKTGRLAAPAAGSYSGRHTRIAGSFLIVGHVTSRLDALPLGRHRLLGRKACLFQHPPQQSSASCTRRSSTTRSASISNNEAALYWRMRNPQSAAAATEATGIANGDGVAPLEQIIRNEAKPAHELVAEKELSSYSRFTRNKSVAPCARLCASPNVLRSRKPSLTR